MSQSPATTGTVVDVVDVGTGNVVVVAATVVVATAASASVLVDDPHALAIITVAATQPATIREVGPMRGRVTSNPQGVTSQ
jgi:hypothetical protein